MEKTKFYSFMCKAGKKQAVLQDGYSDGEFNYYKGYSEWHAIHPLCGLSVATGGTRKQCAENAHAPALLEEIARRMDESGAELTKVFNNAIMEAQTRAEVIA